MPAMKSLAYVSTFLPQRCGVATYTSYLVEGIREVAPDVKIKIIAEKGALPVRRENFEVIPCWSRNENYVEQIFRRSNDVDVMHVQHEYSIYKFDDRLPSLLTKLPAGTRKIVTIHCVRPSQVSERGSVDETIAQRIAELADRVVVHLHSQKGILARLGTSSEKISVVPHGTKLSDEDQELSRARLGLPQRAKIMLMFGFVKPHKCLHIALEALHRILRDMEDVCLFIAGGLAPNASRENKDYIGFIKERIKELKLREKVIFPNRFFPNEDVPYIFRASDIVLFPYYEEDRSASGSLHLAMGAERPIIATRIPKFEDLRNVSDELLVLPYNADSIAKLVLRLFTDRDFKRYVVKRTDEYRKLTSWRRVAEKHLELYEEALLQN